MEQLSEDFVFSCIQPRAQESHKGSYGHVLLAAGSRRYRGAANLAAEGALRSGAGIVTLAAIEPVIAAAAARLPECCLLPCPEGADGGISAGAAAELLAAREKAGVLLMGPRHGQYLRYAGAGARPCGRGRLHRGAGRRRPERRGGLLAAGEALPRPAGSLILTPHPGEMARLTGLPVAEIEANRPGVAAQYARAWGCTIVLKGHRTIVAAPDGRLWRNATGNAGLARGGQRGRAGRHDRRPCRLRLARARGRRLRGLAPWRGPPTAAPNVWASTGCSPTTSSPTWARSLRKTAGENRDIWYTKEDKTRLREKGAVDRMKQADRFSGVLRRALQSTAWFAAGLLAFKLLLFRNIGWTGYAVAVAIWLALQLAGRGGKVSNHPDGNNT